MIPTISCTAPAINPDASFDASLSPYDCRPSADSTSAHRIPLYPPYDTPSHIQPAGKRLSTTIVASPVHPRARFPSDGAGRNSHTNSTSPTAAPMDWMFHHSDHTYQTVEPISLKQPGYDHDPTDVQGIQVHQVGTFTDMGSSINNTRVFHNLEGHHHQMNLPYLAPQYPTQLHPLPHTEGVRPPAPSPSWGYDIESYYGSQAASTQYPMDLSPPDQINFDSQPVVSNNLHHHVHGYSNDHHQQPSQLNQAHVSNNGGSFELTPSTTVAGVGTGQPQVDMTAAAAAAHPPPPPSSSSSSSSPSSTSSFRHHLYALPGSVPRVFDPEGCTDIPQLAVHSERPPLSSYSEFSAQMKYFSHMTSAHQISPAQVHVQQQQQQQQHLQLQLQLQLQPPSLISAMSGPGRVWTGSNSSVSPSSSGDNTPITAPTGILLSSSSSSSSATTAAQDLSSSSSSSTTSSLSLDQPWRTSSLPIKTESVDAATLTTIIPHSKRLAPSSDATLGSTATTASLRRRGTPPSPTAPSSSSDTSRRSRTLSPSSRTIGGLKTIMMRKGTSEPKKQNLACLFCRERKIACGRPAEGSMDHTCNQCARRSLVCQYPTESRRGQHKRSKKNQPDHQHGHNVNRAK